MPGSSALTRLTARRAVSGAAKSTSLLLVAILMAACSPDANQSPQAASPSSASPTTSPSTTSPSPSRSSSPSPTPAATKKATTSPLSGRKKGMGKPVMVVKIDNTHAAQPHRGLTAADIVYVEPVEWGLTRLAAVFSTEIPDVVGPVRSARISDMAICAPYGNVAFVFSGAQRKLWPKIWAANWQDWSDDHDSYGFYRERTRRAPVNLMARPELILKKLHHVAESKDMGLVFQAPRLAGGEKAKRVTARWPNSTVQFRWNKAKNGYDVWMDGQPARATERPYVQRASTVIVQYVEEVDSGYGDKFGGRTPKVILVGKGKGLVFRDGRMHRITWQRSRKSKPTAYLDSAGQPIALDPGQIWIVLMDRDRKVTIG